MQAAKTRAVRANRCAEALSMLGQRVLLQPILVLGLLAFFVGAGSVAAAQGSKGDETSVSEVAEAGAGEGAVLWRAGDQDGALRFWMDALESGEALPARERARLAYNVGVAHHTAEEPLVAAAWFESALRLAPRWEAAKANRDLARADAGLDPKDTGIVSGFVRQFTRGEAEWLAFFSGVLVLVFGALDAFRGGAWGRGPWLAILALPVLWAPLIGQLASSNGEVAMVTAENGAALYGTPDLAGDRLGKLKEGEETLVLDRLPGWVKVVDRGEESWAPEDSVLSLVR